MRKFMVLGLGAISTLTLTLGAGLPTAYAAPAEDGLISTLCGTLPGTVSDIVSSLEDANTAVDTANADSAAKQTALGVSTTNLVEAVIAHIENVDAGNDGGTTADAVGTTVADYAAKTVAANNAFNSSVDAQRAANALANSSAFAGGIATGLCPV